VKKLFKQRFGLSTRRVAVRTHLPWYVRWVGMSLGAGLLAVLVGWTYQFGQRFAGFDQHDAQVELHRLAEQAGKLEKENAALKSEQAVHERELQIERVAAADLAKQVKALSYENSALKEDLALLQSLTHAKANGEGVSVTRFQVEPDSIPGEYRYRVLLLQTGERTRAFEGNFQLVVDLSKDAKRSAITVPDASERAATPYQLSFRIYHRAEGTFKVPSDASVRSVQVRVFEKGQSQPRVMQTVKLS
jgi:hypothetical protein